MNVIEIKNVSKLFYINKSFDSTNDSLKATLAKGIRNLFKKRQDPIGTKEELWALKDVSLEIKEGERVAFLGRNGAGKSTLFKILTRITEPTFGEVKVKKRISSLLEVGTGFHPDLTGRENIMLSGSIMGMSRQEIKKKFDEIVAFADIAQFLDTPVKYYSSGMFMRLGFAIASQVDSEILIVDEVLAVGDAQFQQRCLNKMNENTHQGRTILFVSHHIEAILALCERGVLLEKGKVKIIGPIKECVNQYMSNFPFQGSEWSGDIGDEHLRIFRACLKPTSSEIGRYYNDEKTVLELEFQILKANPDLMIGFSLFNAHNQLVARSRLCDHIEMQNVVNMPGKYQLNFQFDFELFHPGEYFVKIECFLLNKKRILNDELILKFSLKRRQELIKIEHGAIKEGISLGNRWSLR